MAYDGMYGELSTRGTANETLNLALQIQADINATALEVAEDAQNVAVAIDDAAASAEQAAVSAAAAAADALSTSSDAAAADISALAASASASAASTSADESADSAAASSVSAAEAAASALEAEAAVGAIPITPQAFGAVGDGVADDTLALQAALDAAKGKVLTIPPGTYLTKHLVVGSNTTIAGSGAGSSILKLHPSTPTNQTILFNELWGTLNTYLDHNIVVTGVGFDGANIARTSELLSFIKVRNLRVSRCKIFNSTFIGMSLGGCKEFSVTECEFTACGNPVATSEGGAALWIGPYGGDGTVSLDGGISENFFHNNEWSAIYLNGDRNTVSDNKFRSNKESTIFGTGSQNLITNNIISSSVKKWISASGIELGGTYQTISGNYIQDCGADAISLTDAQVVTITGNTLAAPCRDPASFPTASAITVITTQTAPNQPRYINIVGNNVFVPDSAAYSGVHIGNSGDAPLSVLISQNNLQSNTWTSGKAIKVDANKLSVSTIIQGNPGDFDVSLAGGYRPGRFYAGENLSPAATGTQALTANTMYATVFTVRQPQLWTKIGINVTVAGAGGTLARLGVYDIENGVPTSLVHDAGTVAVSTTGVKEITISKVLIPGTYAMVVFTNGTPTVTADVNSKAAVGCIGSSAIGTGDQVITRALTFAALPSTFGTPTFATGLTPLVTLRYGI
jgi:hypothetical protein